MPPPPLLCRSCQAALWYCRRLGAPARLRPLLWGAAALYTFGLYSEVQFYAHG